MAEVPLAAAVLDDAAAHGLPGTVPPSGDPSSGRRPGSDGPLDPGDWAAVLAAARAGRLEGVLARAVADGVVAVTGPQRAEIDGAHRQAMALALLLERELLHLDRRLGAAGIPYRVLKGPAVAHLDETDPATRAFGDLDLLVRGDDLAGAAAVVTAAGGHRRYETTDPAFDRRFGKGAAFAFGRTAEVDLHRTIAPGPFGLTIDVDELFTATEPLPLAGRTFAALDRPSRFVHAAVHALLGGREPRRSALRDLVITAPADDDERREALARARRWGLSPVVAAAVTEASARFGWAPDPALGTWAHRSRPSAREARWLRAYRGGDRSSALLTLAGLSAVPGARAKLSYAWAVGGADLATAGPAELARRVRRTAATARRLQR